MKCQEFEATTHSLARGQSVEATARAKTLAHIEQCAPCAAAFEEQRTLAAEVQAVVASLADQGASPHVEEALRLAFRQQAGQREAPATRIPAPRWHWPRWANGALAAAALIVLALLTGLMWVKTKPAAQKQEATQHSPTPVGPAPDAGKETSPSRGATDVREQTLAGTSAHARHPKAYHAVRRAPIPEAEAATKFYSLVEEGEVVRLESGQVLRVEVPVSTLVALGVPVAAENRNRFVQADLLVGQDGLARAIRFLPQGSISPGQ